MKSARLPSRASTRVRIVDAAALLTVLTVALLLLGRCGRRRLPHKQLRTLSLMQMIEAALLHYEKDTGVLPPDFVPAETRLRRFTKDDAPPWTPTPASPPEALHYYLANPFTSADGEYVRASPGVNTLDLDQNGLPELVDAWGRPLLYNRRRFPTGSFDNGTDPFHNADTFDLYSVGPDGQTGSRPLPDPREDLPGFCKLATDEAADGDGEDDVNNWRW